MVFRQNRSDYTVSIPISLGAIEWNLRFWRENILSNIKIGTDGTFIWLDNHDLHAVFLSFSFSWQILLQLWWADTHLSQQLQFTHLSNCLKCGLEGGRHTQQKQKKSKYIFFSGRIPPVYRGSVTPCQVVCLYVVQLASGQEEIL